MSAVIIPSRCTDSVPEDLDKPYLVAEEKLDGSRYVLYIGCDPYGRQPMHTLLSRRVSVTDNKHVDKTNNVPHITGLHYAGLEYTVLDGEIMSADFLATNSIMNSSTALAIEKQKSQGWLKYNVFDVMIFRGKDVRGLPLEKRRKILLAIVERMNNEHVQPIEQRQGDLQNYFTEVVGRGGEGLIIKDLRQGYGRGWAKMKKVYDVSCVISGFKPGNGKYSGGIGALALSVYHEGKLVEIGFASGFDDALRMEISKNFAAFEGRVVDVFAHEIQNSKRSADNPIGRLRHPTFNRLRDDVNAKDCTSEKLKADLAAGKTKASRFKKRDV